MKTYAHKVLIVVLLAILAGLYHRGGDIFAQQVNFCVSDDPSNLRFHANKQIDDRIKLASPSTGIHLYTSYSQTLGDKWTRNDQSWTQKGVPLDFTGVAGWNDYNVESNFNQRGATLITPRHYITADHFKIRVGSRIQFFEKDGDPIVRTVSGEMTVPGTDINVGLLDSDVDSSIKYYPLVSYQMTHDYIPRMNLENVYDFPIVIFNQFGQALLRQLDNDDDFLVFHRSYADFTNDVLKVPFSGRVILYDSGQPGFMIVNNQPILLFTHTHSIDGQNLGSYIPAINSVIESMGNSNGYKVTEYDLSGFIKQTSDCIPPASTAKFALEDRVIVQSQIPLYDYFGLRQVLLGTLSVGKIGTVTDGPFYSDGMTWWGVEYDSGEAGYSPEAGLVKYEPDTTAPTVPTGLIVSSALPTRVNLTWTASTDATGIDGYRVYRCLGTACSPTVEIGTAVTTAYSDTTVTENTAYRYSVAAYDQDLNLSARSSAVGTTTPSTVVVVPTVLLTVSKSGTGTGTVSGGGISCGATCTLSVNSGTSVSLSATPSDDSLFTGWTNSTCSGTGTCTLLMDDAKTINAVFTLIPLVGICGTAAKNYSASETFPVGTYCTRGTVTPVSPVNPTAQTPGTWSCSGVSGGASVSCNATRSTQPIGGACSSTINSCTAGSFVEVADSSTRYLWTCNGSNGGQSASCGLDKPQVVPINGICGLTVNSCNTGSFVEVADSSIRYLWTCNGSNGGQSASCNLGKPAPLDPIIPVQQIPAQQQVNVQNDTVYTPKPIYTTPVKQAPISDNQIYTVAVEITRNLEINDTGEDVRLLQKTLNDLGYTVAESGAGSKGMETASFDENTQKALMAYQQSKSSAGIDVNGRIDNLTKILLNKDIERIREASFGGEIDNQDSSMYVPKSFVARIMEKVVLGFIAVFKKLWFF